MINYGVKKETHVSIILPAKLPDGEVLAEKKNKDKYLFIPGGCLWDSGCVGKASMGKTGIPFCYSSFLGSLSYCCR